MVTDTLRMGLRHFQTYLYLLTIYKFQIIAPWPREALPTI